jgi:hypothetical protein
LRWNTSTLEIGYPATRESATGNTTQQDKYRLKRSELTPLAGVAVDRGHCAAGTWSRPYAFVSPDATGHVKVMVVPGHALIGVEDTGEVPALVSPHSMLMVLGPVVLADAKELGPEVTA